MNLRRERSRCKQCQYSILVIAYLISATQTIASAQSIGYHPQFNFGFNPYFSPVFGYGLGLPFGAYNISPTRYPWLLSSMPPTPLADKTGLISKIHAKAFLSKLATSQVLSPGFYGIKDKLNLLKHPENAYTPFGAGYGYGKHYGAALVPNNPYKGMNGIYHDSTQLSNIGQAKMSISKPGSLPVGGRLPDSHGVAININPLGRYLKPLLKVGAFLTTATLLGKKFFEIPAKLNPTGMIINEIRP